MSQEKVFHAGSTKKMCEEVNQERQRRNQNADEACDEHFDWQDVRLVENIYYN